MIMNTNSNRNSIRTKARKMRSKAAAVVEDVEQVADSVVQRTLSRVETLRTTGAKYVRNHPWQTALAAVAVGFIAGFRARR